MKTVKNQKQLSGEPSCSPILQYAALAHTPNGLKTEKKTLSICVKKKLAPPGFKTQIFYV